MSALRLIGHSTPGVPAAHVTCPLPFTTRDRALKDNRLKVDFKTSMSFGLLEVVLQKTGAIKKGIILY